MLRIARSSMQNALALLLYDPWTSQSLPACPELSEAAPASFCSLLLFLILLHVGLELLEGLVYSLYGGARLMAWRDNFHNIAVSVGYTTHLPVFTTTPAQGPP